MQLKDGRNTFEQQILSKIAVSNYELDQIRKIADEIFSEYKKQAAKCDEWYAYAVAPYTFRIVRYCDKPKTLNQTDIDKNRNNQLR